MTGTLAMFGALLAWGFWGYGSSQAVKGVHPIAIQWLYSIPYTLMIPVWFWLGRGERSHSPPTRHNVMWVLIACSVSMIASYLFGLALKYERTAVVVGVTSAYPLVTILLLSLTGSEAVKWQHIVGGMLIVCGVILVQISPSSDSKNRHQVSELDS